MDAPPNILWITVDSVRQDRTTMGGHDRDTTPNMMSVGQDDKGQVFENCASSGTWTLASSASILTGTYPSHNTVGLSGEYLPEELPTVAELLSDIGYRTACLSRNSHVSEASGLDRGFDRMSWLASSTLLSAAGPLTATKYLLNIRRHSAGLTLDTAKHASPFIMNDVAKRWLGKLATSEPYFLYMHYNEPHRPYVPPIPWQDRYTAETGLGADEAVDLAMDHHETVYDRIANEQMYSSQEMEGLLAMYDAEVAYTDHCIGELLNYVQSLGGRETWIVLTSDHGELFGEQGVLAHHLVADDALINVPMVLKGPPIAVDSTAPIGHVDIMRTVLEAVGAETSSLQGVDLASGGRGFSISQRAPPEFGKYEAHNPDFDPSRFHDGLLSALRTESHKLLKSPDRTELVKIGAEVRPSTDEQSERYETLDRKLTEWLTDAGQPVGNAREGRFTEAMRDQLAGLGYLDT
jgi:uncharacterized sulfatase